MSYKNPTRPKESPLRVETSGVWQADKAYQQAEEALHERNKHRAATYYPPGSRTEVFESVKDYQKSKSPEVQSSKALDRAIDQDLRNRNLK